MMVPVTEQVLTEVCRMLRVTAENDDNDLDLRNEAAAALYVLEPQQFCGNLQIDVPTAWYDVFMQALRDAEDVLRHGLKISTLVLLHSEPSSGRIKS